jgi:hypothetical protein
MTYYPAKNSILTLFVTLVLTACSSQPNIPFAPIQNLDQETSDLADIRSDALNLAQQLGAKNVLMVFDIDNTLLAMEQGLGADQWYEWQKELSQDDRCNPQNVGNRFAAQGAIYFASAMRPTQADAAAEVNSIQDQGIAVIAITARGHDYRLQTFRELRRNSFDFTFSAIGPDGGYAEVFEPIEGGRMSRYEDGVFLTAGQHKGEMLQALLLKTGTPMPAVIVMADDKQKNLDAVKQTFSSLNIPIHAWRYTGEDENVQNFDYQKAAEQWQEIESSLRQIQRVFGPDNYDLSSAELPEECAKDATH